MTKQTISRTATVVRACAVPRNWTSAHAVKGVLVDTAAFDFVLVANTHQYEQVLAGGGQPILVTRDFSVTDRRGKLRLRLGALIEPWRLRRTLLNEGVTRLTIVPGPGARAYRIAALMGRVPV